MMYKEFLELAGITEKDLDFDCYLEIESLYMNCKGMPKICAVDLYKSCGMTAIRVLNEGFNSLIDKLAAEENQRKELWKENEKNSAKVAYFEDLAMTLDAISEKTLKEQYIEAKAENYKRELDEQIKNLA